MNHDPDDVERNDSQLSGELQHFAAELARLRPRDDRLDRERLAFLAGQASVARVSDRPVKLLGLPLESRAWPAAFASMTAVAALLLVVLIMRPDTPQVRPSAVDNRVYNDAPLLAVERREAGGVLSTRDAHLVDIEAHLASRQWDRTDFEPSPAPSNIPDVPVLTPIAWQQVINETETARPSTHDASGLSLNRGVHS